MTEIPEARPIATPDPRLDLVASLLGDVRSPEAFDEMARLILDALDDIDPGLAEWERALILERQRTPTPPGLSVAQHIRLETFKVLAEQLSQWTTDQLTLMALRCGAAIETGEPPPRQ